MKYLLSAQCMLGTFLGKEDTAVKKQGLFPSWTYILVEEKTMTRVSPNILYIRKWLSAREKNSARKGYWEFGGGEQKY